MITDYVDGNRDTHCNNLLFSEFDGNDCVLCRVCGDKASGFHYGVHSCEGCKVGNFVIAVVTTSFIIVLLIFCPSLSIFFHLRQLAKFPISLFLEDCVCVRQTADHGRYFACHHDSPFLSSTLEVTVTLPQRLRLRFCSIYQRAKSNAKQY